MNYCVEKVPGVIRKMQIGKLQKARHLQFGN